MQLIPTTAFLGAIPIKETDLTNAVHRHGLPFRSRQGVARQWSERDFILTRVYLRLRGGGISPARAVGAAERITDFAMEEGADLIVTELDGHLDDAWWRGVKPEHSIADILEDYAWCHEDEGGASPAPAHLHFLNIARDRADFQAVVKRLAPAELGARVETVG